MNRTKLSENVLDTALQQFVENINHRQKLFIQFFLGVVIVIFGFSVVYNDTDQNAFFWKNRREGDNHSITSYSISALIGSYVIAQSVLILLGRFILSSGFSYRKYQAVIYKIRKECLGKNFNTFFGDGDKEFSPFHKSGCFSSNSYLPEFETIFFVFIWALQLLLFISILPKLSSFNHPVFNNITQPIVIFKLVSYEIKLVHFWVILLAFIPLIFTGYFQNKYYFKYLSKVFSPVDRLDAGENINPEFERLEYLKKYKRKISLSLGYMLLSLLCNGVMLIFLIIDINWSDNYFYNWEAGILLAAGLLFYIYFLYNIFKAYKRLRHFYETSDSIAIYHKLVSELKNEFKGIQRTEWGKKHRIIQFKMMLLLYTIIFFMLTLLFYSKNYSFYWWPFIVLYTASSLIIPFSLVSSPIRTAIRIIRIKKEAPLIN